ncbi:MAG: DUF4954 family protein [Candidatus Omnitrophica bacterium]|nr:DUF4954 family protein [Candidatus Omnitrophota bacterium]
MAAKDTKAILDSIKKTMEASELSAALNAKRAGSWKAVSKDQIAQLEAQGNAAEDWSKIQVVHGFKPEWVKNTYFGGEVKIGNLSGKIELKGGIQIPAGIIGSRVIDSTIGNNVLVSGVTLLANYIVEDNAVVMDSGIVAVQGETSFGNGTEISFAIETGGREVRVFTEITVDQAAALASSRGDKQFLAGYGRLLEAYLQKVTATQGIIGKGARLIGVPRLVDTFVGPGARIEQITAVEKSTILSNEGEATEILDGAWVRSSLIQWGCEVASGAIVDQSVMTEHSHVERHGKVTQSLLGPNTGIAEGEVTACLVGPFVGFHHQSLLIAAYWPEGKGNVGYGANVGSNHTSKAPDQEIWAGEGTFFGLGVNIKFPSNFSNAPYSIVATAVNALPQRVEFPFSLINTPAKFYPGVSPAYNEIMPAWVLSDNIYTVKRNEGKYMKRNKARRSELVFEVLRPDIIDLVIEARKRLQSVAEKKEVYSDRDIKGLGKNYLLEASREKAIETYTFYLQYYGLLGLKKQLENNAGTTVLEDKTSDARWEHERAVLNAELPGVAVEDLLQKLADMQKIICDAVRISKEKDDKRGARIIDDYPEAHAPASEDSFVKETVKVTEQMVSEIQALISKLAKKATAAA